MCMIYLHTKFHMPSSSDSSWFPSNKKLINGFRMTTVLFYILQKITLKKLHIF
jgi:hypothetical protein